MVPVTPPDGGDSGSSSTLQVTTKQKNANKFNVPRKGNDGKASSSGKGKQAAKTGKSAAKNSNKASASTASASTPISSRQKHILALLRDSPDTPPLEPKTVKTYGSAGSWSASRPAAPTGGKVRIAHNAAATKSVPVSTNAVYGLLVLILWHQ